MPAGGGVIDNITLHPSDQIVEQDLPLDPSGVIYDSSSRTPVTGAVISITGPVGFDPTTQLVGGAAAQTQTVGSDGFYQFLLQNAFPTGTYTLSVIAPGGYQPAPSVALPPCTNAPLVVGAAPAPALVQSSNTAPGQSVPQPPSTAACPGLVPGGSNTTQYFFSFDTRYSLYTWRYTLTISSFVAHSATSGSCLQSLQTNSIRFKSGLFGGWWTTLMPFF